MENEYTVIVDLLRHGEPEGKQCLRGRTDHALTETGWEQLSKATINNPGWTQVVSSPLQRCSAFAQNYSQKSGLPLHINPDFQEINFGLWDGKTYKELYESEPEALSGFWKDPYLHTPPQGEPLKLFNQRVQQAWEQLIGQAKGEHILLITHGGVIRQILAKIFELPETSTASIKRMYLPYASQCRVEVYVDGSGQQWPRLMFPGVHLENNDQ